MNMLTVKSSKSKAILAGAALAAIPAFAFAAPDR